MSMENVSNCTNYGSKAAEFLKESNGEVMTPIVNAGSIFGGSAAVLIKHEIEKASEKLNNAKEKTMEQTGITKPGFFTSSVLKGGIAANLVKDSIQENIDKYNEARQEAQSEVDKVLGDSVLVSPFMKQGIIEGRTAKKLACNSIKETLMKLLSAKKEYLETIHDKLTKKTDGAKGDIDGDGIYDGYKDAKDGMILARFNPAKGVILDESLDLPDISDDPYTDGGIVEKPHEMPKGGVVFDL